MENQAVKTLSIDDIMLHYLQALMCLRINKCKEPEPFLKMILNDVLPYPIDVLEARGNFPLKSPSNGETATMMIWVMAPRPVEMEHVAVYYVEVNDKGVDINKATESVKLYISQQIKFLITKAREASIKPGEKKKGLILVPDKRIVKPGEVH